MFLIVVAAPAQNRISPEKAASMKEDLVGQVDAMKKQAQVMVDSVFSFGELGFQEFETSKYLTGLLEKEGFKIERDVAGIPTAFVATWGQGKPVIALGSDIDDIPQASQKPAVPYHVPMIEGAPGHGEGHNSGMPLNIVAALAVKQVMEREHLSGTLKLWPGIAEEQLGTKAYYVREGLFKDVDVVLFAHVGDNFRVTAGPGNQTGMVSVEYTFRGETAHAAGAPWRGRSALDAVELMDIGWNFRREHIRVGSRVHYVITNGGDQPNVVPANATVWYYYREADYQFTQLVEKHKTSPLYPKAVEMAIISKALSTGGSDYDGRKVAEARDMIPIALASYQQGGGDDDGDYGDIAPAGSGVARPLQRAHCRRHV